MTWNIRDWFRANELSAAIAQAHDEHKPVLINLWAPPGVGKSTTMAAIFNTLKHRHRRAEMSPEVAKRHTYENNRMALSDSFYVASAQEYQNHMLRAQVDYIVTDSPPGLAIAFAHGKDRKVLMDLVRHWRQRYVNVDVLLTRDPSRPFQNYGRNQTLEQSKALTRTIEDVLVQLTNNTFVTMADNEAPEKIIKFVDREVLPYAAVPTEGR